MHETAALPPRNARSRRTKVLRRAQRLVTAAIPNRGRAAEAWDLLAGTDLLSVDAKADLATRPAHLHRALPNLRARRNGRRAELGLVLERRLARARREGYLAGLDASLFGPGTTPEQRFQGYLDAFLASVPGALAAAAARRDDLVLWAFVCDFGWRIVGVEPMPTTEPELQQFVASDPRAAQGWVGLTLLVRLAGCEDAAVGLEARVRGLNPAAAGAWFVTTGRWSDTVDVLRELVDRHEDPRARPDLVRLLATLHEAGRSTEAAAMLRSWGETVWCEVLHALATGASEVGMSLGARRLLRAARAEADLVDARLGAMAPGSLPVLADVADLLDAALR